MSKKENGANDQTVPRARVEGLIYVLTGRRWEHIRTMDASERRRCLMTIKQKLARERNKGVACHWSYDLNRHLSLKAAKDLIEGSLGP